MGSVILKASPDEDLYGIYSNNVDAFTYTGTRAEIRTVLINEGGHPMEVNGRFARTDALGSSCGIADDDYQVWYGWKEETIRIMEGPGGPGELPRASLSAYLRALESDDETAAASLVNTTVKEA